MVAKPAPRKERLSAAQLVLREDDHFVAPGDAANASPALALQDQLHNAVSAVWSAESTIDAPSISRAQLLTIIGCACGSWGLLLAAGWALLR